MYEYNKLFSLQNRPFEYRKKPDYRKKFMLYSNSIQIDYIALLNINVI